MTESAQLIEEIVGSYEANPDMLIPMMQDIQSARGYLPQDCLRALAGRLKVPLTRVYEVATFYSSFRLAPKGRHEVVLCMGTVCYLKGAPRIADAISREFKVQPGGTTPDRLFSFQGVNCVGACAVAPVMIVDGEYHDGVTPEFALEILRNLPAESAEVREEVAT
jgi:NADH-quinone oxidoreductase subunit E